MRGGDCEGGECEKTFTGRRREGPASRLGRERGTRPRCWDSDCLRAARAASVPQREAALWRGCRCSPASGLSYSSCCAPPAAAWFGSLPARSGPHHHSTPQTGAVALAASAWTTSLQLLPSTCSTGCKTVLVLCSPDPPSGDEGTRTLSAAESLLLQRLNDRGVES